MKPQTFSPCSGLVYEVSTPESAVGALNSILMQPAAYPMEACLQRTLQCLVR